MIGLAGVPAALIFEPGRKTSTDGVGAPFTPCTIAPGWIVRTTPGAMKVVPVTVWTFEPPAPDRVRLVLIVPESDALLSAPPGGTQLKITGFCATRFSSTVRSATVSVVLPLMSPH